MPDKKTLYINLFGGPGVGKSTLAAGLFWFFKTNRLTLKHSYVIELVREFAKDLVWAQDLYTLKNQVYVTSTQYHRMYVLNGKVDMAITDSPLLLGLLYGDYPASYKPYLLDLHNTFNNLNIFIERKVPFEQEGRQQNEIEAIDKDREIKNILTENNIEFIIYNELFSYESLRKLSLNIIDHYNRINESR